VGGASRTHENGCDVCVKYGWKKNLKGGREKSVSIGAYGTSDIAGRCGCNLFRSQ